MPPLETSPSRTISRVILGLALCFTGVGHLTFLREQFHAQVPQWVPLPTDLVVLLSGVAEVALGASLVLLPRYRVVLGWVAAAFFVAVFPGNIAQYLNGLSAFGLDTDAKRFGRLFLQPVFVAWALWSTGAWRDRRRLTGG